MHGVTWPHVLPAKGKKRLTEESVCRIQGPAFGPSANTPEEPRVIFRIMGTIKKAINFIQRAFGGHLKNLYNCHLNTFYSLPKSKVINPIM